MSRRDTVTHTRSPSNPLQTLLSKLTGARQRRYVPRISGVQAVSAWEALCPAHDDTKPSLSILQRSDDSITLRCWVGCPIDDILGAVGLQRRDLFPQVTDSTKHHHEPHKPRIDSAAVLRMMANDCRSIGIGVGLLLRGELTERQAKELERLAHRVANRAEENL